MTALLEKLIAIIAPHQCLGCSKENSILCEICLNDIFVPIDSACIFCAKPTVDWRVCANCQKTSALSSVWVAGEYEGKIAELLGLYKFERVRAAYEPLAKALDGLLPYLEPNDLLVPLPTAPQRVRQRGYDQSVLLAKELARLRSIECATALERSQSTRQVGADRKTRLQQARLAYALPRPSLVKGKRIWLVDDICTTGASLNAAAHLLRKAGAAEVNGVVVGWQRLGPRP